MACESLGAALDIGGLGVHAPAQRLGLRTNRHVGLGHDSCSVVIEKHIGGAALGASASRVSPSIVGFGG